MNSSGRFLGMQIKLGQAFSLRCLIEFGPLLPIKSTWHLKKRVAETEDDDERRYAGTKKVMSRGRTASDAAVISVDYS